MKFLSIIFFIFSISYSITFVGNDVILKDLNEKNYKAALKNFNNKNYKLSYKQFSNLLKQSNYQNLKYNYYLAISAYHLKLYYLTIAAYERILFYKPYDDKANFGLSKIYYKLKQFNLSTYYINKIIKHSKNQKFLKKVKNYIKSREIGKNTLNITTIIGSGYDSNINNSSNKDKSFATQTVIVNDLYKYKYFDINNNILLYNKKVFNDNNSNNFLLLRYKPSIIYNNIKNGLIMEYSEYSNHSYMRKLGFFTKINFPINSLELQLYLKKYLQNRDNYRNAYHIRLKNTTYKKIDNNNLYTTVQVDSETATKESKSDVDYRDILIKLKDNYMVSNSFILTPIIGYNFKYYTIENEKYNKHQKNNQIKIGLQTLNILQNFDIQTALEYIKNISNISLYKYHKWIFNINLIKQFQGL